MTVKVHCYYNALKTDPPFSITEFEDKRGDGFTVAEITRKVSKTLNICPNYFPLFGLIDDKHKFWLPPNKTFSHSLKCTNVFFRMKLFFPGIIRILKDSHGGSNALWYLYYQCRNDFISERFPIKNDCDYKDLFGLAMWDLAISAEKHKVDVRNIWKRFDVKQFLPKTVLKEYFKFRIRDQLKKEISEKLNIVGNRQIATYIDRYLHYCEKYSVNNYSVLEMNFEEDERKQTTLTLDLFSNSHPEVFIGKESLCQIDDLRELKITNTAEEWYVEIYHNCGCPKKLKFVDGEPAALSSSSLIDGYYRIMVDPFDGICLSVVSPFVEFLKRNDIHGPISSKFAVEKLQKSTKDNQGNVLLKQSAQELYLYKLFKSDEEVLLIHEQDNQFFFQDSQKYDSLECLLKSLLDMKNGLTKLPLVRPQRASLEEKSSLLMSPLPDKKSSSVIYDRSSSKELICVTDVYPDLFIGSGRYTDVYRGYIKESDLQQYAVKTLREFPEWYKAIEPFQACAAKMRQFKSIDFLSVAAVCLVPPFRMIIEYSRYGPLSELLSHNGSTINNNSLTNVGVDVANGLLYMEESNLVHGNINADNIFVMENTDSDPDKCLSVKIGDLGLIDMYDKLPVNHKINISRSSPNVCMIVLHGPNTKNKFIVSCTPAVLIPEDVSSRIPWLDPLLLDKMDAKTTNTDIFAFGTTLWEVFNLGNSPFHEKLKNLENNQLIEQWKQKKHVDLLGYPERLQDIQRISTDEGSDTDRLQQLECIWRLIGSCWDVSSTLITSRDIIKVLNGVNFEALPEISENESITTNATNRQIIDIEPLDQFVCIQPKWVEATEKKSSHLPRAHLGPVPLTPRDEDIPSSLLKVDKNTKLGEGHFGEVIKANYESNVGTQTVAIKFLLKNHNPQIIEEISKEVEIMKSLQHEHIVQLIGTCTIEGKRGIIMEFCNEGSLLSYLKKIRRKHEQKIPENIKGVLNRFCCDVSKGMEYLSSQKIVHRDLASRNILLMKQIENPEQPQAKISDFGLSCRFDEGKDYYKNKHSREMQWFLMTPEYLRTRKNTAKCDVWSFGHLMWEIYSLGQEVTFCDQTGQKLLINKNDPKCVLQFIQMMEKGDIKLTIPNHCPLPAYDIISKCQKIEPTERPSFSQLVERLSKLCNNNETS